MARTVGINVLVKMVPFVIVLMAHVLVHLDGQVSIVIKHVYLDTMVLIAIINVIVIMETQNVIRSQDYVSVLVKYVTNIENFHKHRK
jgi:hypothetical protein